MNNQTTLKNLQTALAMELTAAHQYQLHASRLSVWGMDRLAAKMHQEMQEELGHSEAYLTRILFLKGEPNLVLATPPVMCKSLVHMPDPAVCGDCRKSNAWMGRNSRSRDWQHE